MIIIAIFLLSLMLMPHISVALPSGEIDAWLLNQFEDSRDEAASTEKIKIPVEQELSDIFDTGYYSLCAFIGVLFAVLVIVILKIIIEISIRFKSRKLKNSSNLNYRNLKNQMVRPLVDENEYSELPKGNA
ncbi:unnamed protein product [Chironomus riparius]|uniref:Uncharacterized protein n=1 Tax=Chironomus riparius TaxID=315576 RepID=A0A9N9S9J0_9DIPT|nr:unnamed protein product [Chironomus riparius]